MNEKIMDMKNNKIKDIRDSSKGRCCKNKKKKSNAFGVSFDNQDLEKDRNPKKRLQNIYPKKGLFKDTDIVSNKDEVKKFFGGKHINIHKHFDIKYNHELVNN